MIRAGIIGGAGYTAGELIRLLLAHPQARIVFVHSTSNAGNRLADVHGGLEGDIEMRLSDAYDLQAIDVLFLCSAHGESREWMEANTVPAGVKIIDLAQDFRDESVRVRLRAPRAEPRPYPHGHSASPTRAASPRRSSWRCSRSQRRDY